MNTFSVAKHFRHLDSNLDGDPRPVLRQPCKLCRCEFVNPATVVYERKLLVCREPSSPSARAIIVIVVRNDRGPWVPG